MIGRTVVLVLAIVLFCLKKGVSNLAKLQTAVERKDTTFEVIMNT